MWRDVSGTVGGGRNDGSNGRWTVVSSDTYFELVLNILCLRTVHIESDFSFIGIGYTSKETLTCLKYKNVVLQLGLGFCVL